MESEEGCAEMMEALSIGGSPQRIEPVSGSKLEHATEDMLDGYPPTTQDSLWGTGKQQKQCDDRRYVFHDDSRVVELRSRRTREGRIASTGRKDPVLFHRRCCVICGYHAPHRMLLQLHLTTCRKMKSWPALYSSRFIEPEMVQVPFGVE